MHGAVFIDEHLAAHLARAVAFYREHLLRVDCVRVPELEHLGMALKHVSDGHGATDVVDPAPRSHRRSVELQLLPLDETAQVLGGVDVRTVQRYIASGTLRAKKLGGRTMVASDDLADFIRALPDKENRQ